jgi:hypothetical protein
MRLPGQIMLDLIKPALGETGIEFVELRGNTTDRARPVAPFQRGEVPLFLISLKAGGTGLNLTAADTVIHYDPWWNLAARIRRPIAPTASARALPSSSTERTLELQQHKKALAAGIFEPHG